MATTRDRLLDSALHRFATEGALGATLDDVRADAGASVGAVYHHFPDKQALYDAVRTRALADFQGHFVATLEEQADAESGIRAIVDLQVRWCMRNRDAARLLLEGPPAGAGELNREFFPRVRSWWATHAHYGELRDLDFALIHAIWLGPATELVRHWLAGDARRPGRREIETLADAAWAALKETP
jgi:AcrR family transcriptional regulator